MTSKKAKQRVDPVEVFCRTRPLPADADAESCLQILDEYNLLLQIPESSASYRSGQIKQLVYSFSQIFDETTTQKQLFEHIGLSLVQDLLVGKNGLLFTYGVTGSGKTYSMIGNQTELGLLQRSLDTLFNSISFQQAKKYIFKPDRANSFEIQTETDASLERQHRRDYFASMSSSSSSSSSAAAAATAHRNKIIVASMDRLNEPNGKLVNVNEDHIYAVFISCIEIYNNYIYDLLDDSPAAVDSNNQNAASSSAAANNANSNGGGESMKESKSLKEDARGCMYIKDVNEIEVKSTEEALDLMHRAQKRRVVASTDLNAESSRSHTIFTIRVVQSAYDPSKHNAGDAASVHAKNKHNLHVSQLSLVDLAGSERTKRTKNTGSRLREAGSINSSLMALRNCMEALRDNVTLGSRKMVPYRDSKLTLLFKNYFEGHGKIKMILCINPSAVEFDETINVLKFSDLVKDVLVQSSAEPHHQQVATSSAGGGGSGKHHHQHKQQHHHHHHQQAHANNANNALQISDKMSIEMLEQANLLILANLQQNNYSLMNEAFPPLDVYGADDEHTLRALVVYLEEFQRRRAAVIHETDSLKQLFYARMREANDELERTRDERNELKQRLESKDKDQVKAESKIRALEKLVNSNASTASSGGGGSGGGGTMRTPMSSRPPLHYHTTPMIPGSSGTGSGSHASNASSGTNNNNHQQQQQQQQQQHHHHGPPSISTLNTADTPVTSTFRSSRITQSTTHSVGRNIAIFPPPPPPTSAAAAAGPSAPPPPASSSATPSLVSSRLTSITNTVQQQQQQRHQQPSNPQQTPSRTTNIQQQYLRHIQQQQAQASALKEGVPVANRRAHQRRSKSAEMWLDHKPLTVTKLDTVMQPKMERKISVSKLELSDAKRSSKYVLTHQQQDADGEVITNLIKGKILQSPSGGANVIFTDVETLQTRVQDYQQSAGARLKRGSDENSHQQPVEDRQVVEERCAMAIEGHAKAYHVRQPFGSNKKTKL